MKKIKSIQLLCSNDDEIYYEVGGNRVTEIKEAEKNGESSLIIYYQVFKDGKHYSDVHQFSEVVYEEEV